MKWAADRLASQADKSFGSYLAAAELQRKGADIIHLEVGRPSFDTPHHIKEAAKRALDEGFVHYGDLQGEKDLREALANKLRDYNKIEVDADEVLLTNGLTQASFATFMATLNEGDEAITFEPYYPQHNKKIELVGAKVVTAPLNKKAGFRLDPDALEKAITSKTKLIVFVNPANPVGTVFTKEEVATVGEIAAKHDLLVMTDEVYDYVDGWRIGYAAAKREFIDGVMKVTLNETTHPCVFAQKGACAGVVGPQDCVSEMVAEDQRRRDLVHRRLNEMPKVTCHLPEGTIYAFPDFGAYGMPSKQLADELLREVHVATENGTFYGATGEGHLTSRKKPERGFLLETEDWRLTTVL
jgi:aspartate aminotransferase